MKAYLDIVNKVLSEGIRKENRTGIDTIAIAGAMFEHNMEDGFPLLTTKKVPFKLVASELEFFIKGITDKKWLQDRGNHIWDDWCDPRKVQYGTDEETKKKMKEERELGPIYGFQWRSFGYDITYYTKPISGDDFDVSLRTGVNIIKDSELHIERHSCDQLKNVVDTLKKNPNDRRMIVTAWNPLELDKMALPPCHYSFQVTVIDEKLNLLWNQRSVDVALGLPFNIASYGLLLHLLAKEANLKEGKLIGFLGDVHIYENHIEGLKEQLNREPKQLPSIKTEMFNNIFDWVYTDTIVENYNPDPTIKFEIAV